MTLIYHGSLPAGALIRPDAAESGARGLSTGPTWLSTATGALTPMPGAADRVARWEDPESGAIAVPVGPNAAGTRRDAEGLEFQAGVNGGLVVEGAIPEAGQVTFGAIFRSWEEDAGTLLTLQPRGVKDYLYLAAQGGQLRAEQDAGNFALAQSLPGAPGALTLVLCALDGPRVSVSVNGGAAASGRLEGPGFSGPADLFIGCRGQRAGLKKKLGRFRLTDVFLWGAEGLAGEAAEAVAQHWRERRDA